MQSGEKGLDFGCGSGPAMKDILEARKGVEVQNYDIFYYPDEDLLKKTYDFITVTEVVEHFCAPQKEFELLNSLLKPKGHLGIMTTFYQPDIVFEEWWYRRDETHVCFYQRETFEWIARWLKWSVEFPAENVVIYSRVDR
ncbi:MAG: class I SAM-dependent methyltransferase [Candidatus Omnitrophica bacterium]|nr:class I SAM-dependent methyltransferase [Candidatus Omnitrophota bacterium]